jgi:glycine/D-amino acid oxidase-like deaminating enzyme/nitrite reductase/ring-hydroxylating ferredoxin subunit
LIGDLGIDCDAVDAPAYTCVEDDVEMLEKEYAAALACGLPVSWEVPTELPFPIAGAVMLADQLQIDPVKLCRGVVTRLRALGTSVFEGVRVTGVHEDADSCVVEGPGFAARCDVAVIATHLPIVDPALLAGRTTPVRSYVVACQGTADSPKGMYLAADAGWSVRSAGADRRTVLIGGEGHSVLDSVDSGPHLERLEAWTRDRFGMKVSHRWSAFDYRSVDGLPFVGALAPGSERRYVATGFGKWGMSMSAVAADVIADRIGGRTTPATELFDATRLLETLSRAAVKHNVKVSKRFIGDRIRPSHSDVQDANELQPGTGVVVRRGTSWLALSRGLDGSTHCVDAACTHLGCIVAFNAGEQTWDCPCHGSRFTLEGQVLDGPARDPLESVVVEAQP